MDNNYIGKICPFCKTAFQEGDEIKVCSACGTPHHLNCWNENKGCTTFGCSEQHYEPQGTNPTDVCKKCGAVLGDGQDFCPKCGTPKNAPSVNKCGKCGAELQEGQEFCPKCGQKVGLTIDTGVSSAINQFNANVNKINKSKLKKAAIALAVIAIVIIGAIVAVPKLFVSVDDLCAQGNYEKAYEKAKSDEDKKAVKVENIAAVQSAFSADNLKDPSSFSLRDAYYNEETSEGETNLYLVLHISGSNSYGASVSNYWLYSWSDDKHQWVYYCSVSDLSDEEYSKYDDTDDFLEKAINNIGRGHIKTAMNSGFKLSKDGVKRINTMFENDTLDSVELLNLE